MSVKMQSFTELLLKAFASAALIWNMQSVKRALIFFNVPPPSFKESKIEVQKYISRYCRTEFYRTPKL